MKKQSPGFVPKLSADALKTAIAVLSYLCIGAAVIITIFRRRKGGHCK